MNVKRASLQITSAPAAFRRVMYFSFALFCATSRMICTFTPARAFASSVSMIGPVPIR
jgi:hypothetical protein